MCMSTKTPININDEREVRIAKMDDLKNAGMDPYPAIAQREQSAEEALVLDHGSKARVAGRLMMKREIGKLTFGEIQDASGRIQICAKQDELGKALYKLFVKKVDIGDIIEISGTRFQTNKGQESLLVHEWRMLAKALRPLPDKFHGLQDEEMRLRKRYLDLFLNPDLREMFHRKATFWNSMREFLIAEGFLEVETPTLEAAAGGADATTILNTSQRA